MKLLDECLTFIMLFMMRKYTRNQSVKANTPHNFSVFNSVQCKATEFLLAILFYGTQMLQIDTSLFFSHSTSNFDDLNRLTIQGHFISLLFWICSANLGIFVAYRTLLYSDPDPHDILCQNVIALCHLPNLVITSWVKCDYRQQKYLQPIDQSIPIAVFLNLSSFYYKCCIVIYNIKVHVKSLPGAHFN